MRENMQYEMKWRVQYYETDRMGIVHHSNYIRYFETARTEFIRHEGLPYESVEEMGVMIPVLAVSAEYKTPAVYDEILSISCRFTKLGYASFELEYEVRNDETGELHVRGWSKQAFTDETLKPVAIRKAAPVVHEVFSRLYKESQEKAGKQQSDE